MSLIQSLDLLFSKEFATLQPPAMLWFVCSIVTDSTIVAATIYHLRSVKTGFRDTDQMITKICRGVVETGLATTTIVILNAIFFFRSVIIISPLLSSCRELSQLMVHGACHAAIDQLATLCWDACKQGMYY